MKPDEIVEQLTKICEKLDIEIRFEPLASSGGLVKMRGKETLFIGTACSRAEQASILCEALMDKDLESLYILPGIREIIEQQTDRIRIQKNKRDGVT